MNHEKFQSGALIVLCAAVVMLTALMWAQNLAIENVSRAIETLSRSGSVITPLEPSPAPVAPTEPAPAPAP
ncbi:MAG TPA: hypothetical protein VL426_02775 [Candidatus Binatia bacterium]|jgi:hypothetical protein|nr:hypothetical protein [Candidatus Binatia bacterium]